MIVVKVELWPGGDMSKAREIASMNISNVSNLAARSDYRVIVDEQPSDITGMTDGMNENFVVQNHKRRQSVWAIVGRAAYSAVTHWSFREMAKENKAAREKGGAAEVLDAVKRYGEQR